MTTKIAGGKITGHLALTVEAQEAVKIGDWLHLIGPYEAEIADGTRPVVGQVSVSNVRGRARTDTSETWGLPVVPGDVTVEARGWSVAVHPAGGAIEAGRHVAIGAAGALIQYDPAPAPGAAMTPDRIIGIALTGAAAAGTKIDVLVL